MTQAHLTPLAELIDARKRRRNPRSWPMVLVNGAIAGATATFAMSGFMLQMQRLGLLGRSPPRHIVEAALRASGLRSATNPQVRKLLTAAAHVGFGATQGALFAVLTHAPTLVGRGVIVPSANKGMAFGLAVWGANYAGWIPLAGILPRPSRDRPGRPTSMVVAHLLYGLVLAKSLASRLQQREVAPHSPALSLLQRDQVRTSRGRS